MAKKYYVTTSIPYVNDIPHIGHAMEFILADVLARYARQQRKDVLFSTGTDEHGGKIMEKAKSMGLTPEHYANQISVAFEDLCTALDVKYDRFIRTTSKQHTDSVKVIWKQLEKYMYKSTYVGMYDQKEEEFITEERAREIRETDPERYGRLQKTEEENYFFKLSVFNDQIKEAIESNKFRILPETRKHEVLALLERGLDDISVSRPKTKIAWGIPVPGDSKQTIYVWFEALMNYITVLGYPKGKDFAKYWPADTQVIGKDIIRFHAAIWPAMLLALDLPLPTDLYVHGFININERKMSKSVGNVVSPLEIVAEYGSDALRYYVLRYIPSYDDGDFSWQKFEGAYNGELANGLGNLVQRLASMINRYQEGVIGDIPDGEHDIGPYEEALSLYRFDKALDYVFGLIRGLNQYIDEEQPWKVAKSKDKEHLKSILAYSVGSLLQIGQLLAPFLPRSAKIIDDIFSSGVVKNYNGTLFPKKDIYTKTDEKN